MHRLCLLIMLLTGLISHFETYSQSNAGFSDGFPVAVNTEFCDFEIRKPKNLQPSNLIKTIRVLDYRPDTFRIGLFQYGIEKLTKELRIRQKFPEKLEMMLNEYLASSIGEMELIVVLKECWVSNFLPLKAVTPPSPKQLRAGIKMMKQLKIDIFEKKQDLWYPYLRIDTIAYSPNFVFQWSQHKLTDLVVDLLQKLSIPKNKSRIVEGVSEKLLHEHYQEPFKFPIYEENHLKKGVYKSFDEFKMNKPSIEEYEIDTLAGYFMVRTKDQYGVSNISRNVWGYCDGTSVYFQIQSIYFPIIRKGRALYVYCSRRPEKRTSSFVVPIPFYGIHFEEILVNRSIIKVDGMSLYRIDLQKGHIY